MSKKLIPNNFVSNDKVYTPDKLSEELVNYFIPDNISVLEPCFGGGSFYRALENRKLSSIDWCEIDMGRDFYNYDGKVDYIITNPPFSQFRKFLQHSMKVSDNIIFLCLINAVFMKARLRDIKENNFGIREILCVDTPPKPFPQFGISLGAIHLIRNYTGEIKFTF